jgi:hypothetical protein
MVTGLIGLAIGAGLFWRVFAEGSASRHRPGDAIAAAIALGAIVGLAGLTMVIGCVVSGFRSSPPRMIRFDFAKRVLELHGFDPGRFAALIPRFSTPRTLAVIPFHDLALAGVRSLSGRNHTTRTFYISTRDTVYIIADLSREPELEHALEECIGIIGKESARLRKDDRAGPPRPLSALAYYLLMIWGLAALIVVLSILLSVFDPV